MKDLGSLTSKSWAKNATLGFEECVAACCLHKGCAAMMYQQASQGDGFGYCTLGQPCCWLKVATGLWDPRPAAEGAKTGILRDHVPPSPPWPAAHRPPPPPPPPTNRLLAFGFVVAGQKKLLLVNTGVLSATGVAVDGSSGARHAFVDEAHGHGSVLPGRETVGAGGTIDVRAYGVSVLSWPTVL